MAKFIKASEQSSIDHPHIPTPDIGWPVQWFARGEADKVYAAVVTKREAAGRVELAITPSKGMWTTVAHYRQGVYHKSHPMHTRRGNEATVNNGCWDYLPGMVVPESHYEMAIQEDARKEAARKQAEETLREQERLFKEQQAAQSPLLLPTPVPIE